MYDTFEVPPLSPGSNSEIRGYALKVEIAIAPIAAAPFLGAGPGSMVAGRFGKPCQRKMSGLTLAQPERTRN
jgi:hypothetical protein